jgi:cytochrome c-type biogenesis protein
LILGASVSEHRAGPAALAAGVAISFVAIGMFVATIGFAMGFDADFFRYIAGILLVGFGLILLVPRLQTSLATAAGPLSGWTEERFGGISTGGLRGQFALGLLLGAVWAPCVGPTLGAASLMAARGENLGEVGLVMTAFGIGAALPLLLLGLVSRDVFMRWRSRLMATGRNGKFVLGGILVAIGALVISGLDKRLETLLIDISPDWLTTLTTSV